MKTHFRKLLFWFGLPLMLCAALPVTQAGHLVRYQWFNSFAADGATRITDYRVAIPLILPFLDHPEGTEVLALNAATVTNPGAPDDYFSLIRGYVIAPEDGVYSFTIASDDSSGFWLSGNHTVPSDFPSVNPTGYREPDAEETGWSSAGLFGALRLGERTTDPVPLTRGQILYFEMVSQEGSGGDFMQIGWTRPDGVRGIIPGAYLMPWEPTATPLALANGELVPPGPGTRPLSGPGSVTVMESSAHTFTVDVYGGVQPISFQWQENGADIPGANLPAYTLERATIEMNNRRYTCVVRDASGASRTSGQAVLTVQPDTEGPRLVSARGSGNPHGILVTFDEDVDAVTAEVAENYSLSGQTVTIQEAVLWAPDQVLLIVSEFGTAPMTLTVNNVTDVSAARNPVASNSQATIQPASSLAGYWPLDEGSGTTTADRAGGYDGILVNEPAWVTDSPTLGGRPNPYALQFDGVTSYVQTSHPGIGGSAARTVAFWIKADSSSLNTHGLVAWGNSTQNGAKYHVRLEPPSASIRTEAQGGNNWATQRLDDGAWHHVVSLLPEGGGNASVAHYVDGVLDPQLGGADVAVNTDITSANAIRVRIGARDQTGALHVFPGLIDDVALFAVALTPEQISQLAQGADPFTLATPLTGPLAFSEHPASQVIQQLRPVAFTAAAGGSPPELMGYQWYRNDVAIPGANNPSLALEETLLADNGAVFHVEAFNRDGTFARIRSNPAVLTVVDDQDPPELVGISALSDPVNRVDLDFDEALDPVTAQDPANYTIDGVTILSAVLSPDGLGVSLFTSGLTAGALYTLQIAGVTDLVGNALTRSVEVTAAMTYSELVLQNGPAAYWSLDELDGTVVNNRVNPGWNATLNSGTGGALPVLGVPGLVPNLPTTAMGFVAAQGNRILIPDHAALNTGGPYRFKTVELWFRADRLPARPAGGSPERMFLFEQGGITRGISLYLSGTQPGNPETAEIHFHAWNRASDGPGAPWGGPEAASLTPVVVIGTVERNITYHAVLVMDGDDTGTNGQLIGFLNGVQVGAASGVGLLYNAGDDAGIGGINQNSVVKEADRQVNYGDPFDGVIDEVSYYNQALTAGQVAAHYQQGVQPGLLPRIHSVFPAPGAVEVTAQDGIRIVFEDQVTELDPDSVILKVGGTTSAPSVTKANGLTTVSFTPSNYPSRALVTVEVTWANSAGVPGAYAWSFTTLAVLPEAWAAPVGSGVNRGFRARSSQATASPTLANTVARAEAQLASPPTPAPEFTGSASLDVVNFSLATGSENGFFTSASGFPDADFSAGLIDPTGINNNNFAVEIVTYLELQPGLVQLGVNSDDGFRLTAGRVPEETSLELAVFNGGRGINNATPQDPAIFQVTRAGVYAFRLVYFQGDGAAGLEWHVKNAAGESFLLNDAGSPIQAFQSRTQDPAPVAQPATLAVAAEGENLAIRFGTESGVLYEVQATASLTAPVSWSQIGSDVLGDGNEARVMATLGPNTRFFRVESK